MEDKNYTHVIPGQRDGEVINAESVVTCANAEQARELFESAKNRLLDVSNWQRLAGQALAGFQLTDSSGIQASGPAQEGFFFKIDIPGPGSEAGDGYDWVQVEKIETYHTAEVDSIGLRVRPASSPENNDPNIAHFYSEDSTSTFTITREGNRVTAAVYDRNTKPNSEAEGILDKVRNFFVGTAGIASFSKIQWKNLTDGVLKADAY